MINFHATHNKSLVMVYRLPSLNALRAFEAAARHLSFKNAALELSVTPTAVSHQIKLLEESNGVLLIDRLTRALALTPQGEAMLPKVREGLQCFAAAVEGAHARVGHGRLIVMLPPSFATRWLVPRLRSFALTQPSLSLHVIRSLATMDGNQAAVNAALESVDLRPEDSLVAIRFGRGVYPGYHVDRVFGSDYIAVCCPKLLETDPPLRVPADMRHQVLLHDDATANDRSGPGWEDWFRLAGLSGVDTKAGPHFGDSGLAYVAALDGLGVALAARPLVANAIAQGRLVAPFDIAVSQDHAYYLVIAEAIFKRPMVQAFRQWLLDEARTEALGGFS